MSVTTQRLLLFFMVIACIPAHAQFPCCQLQPAPGSPFTALPGLSPISVAFSPTANCLAVANQNTNNISIFTVNSECSLDLVSMAGVGNTPRSVAFSPNGTCLAVANQISNNITVFTVDPTTCSLLDAGIPFGLPMDVSGPQSLAFSPLISGDSTCLAVVSTDDTPNVSMFMVNLDDCSLTPVGIPMPVGTFPRSVAFSPDGTCLAVANFTSNDISVFRVNSACTLEEVLGSPFSVTPDSTGPSSVAFSPTNNCLAVANQTSNTISIFTINPDCTLNTPATTYGTESGIGTFPSSVAFSSDGTCLAVANQTSSNVSVFTVNSDCSLTPVPDSPFAVTPNTSRPISLAFSPINNCLAVSSLTTNNISMFSIVIAQQPIITSATVPDCTTSIITVTGTSSPNATITIFVDGIQNTMGSTDENGNFTIEIAPLPIGTHSITAVANVSDCISTPSAPVMVTITFQPTITSVSLGCGNLVTVIGTSAPNSTVSITVDGLPIATGMTNSEGTFIFTGIILSSGMHCITATDTSSGCSSAPVCVDVTSLSCVLNPPNLAFGTHCNRS